VALVFDTETTVDAAQRLRIGAYQFRKGDESDEAGLFYDPASVSENELALLRRACSERGLKLRTVAEFVDEVLYARAYDLRASIVGFNLPFDISRLAIRHGSARGKAMRGGFTFKLSQLWWRPAIQVRHLNARASLIQFTHPPKRRDPRGQRKRQIAPRNRRGSFIDLKTVATQIVHIGKEANKWEEQYFLGEDEEAEIEYGAEENDSFMEAKTRASCEEIGQRAAAEKIGISRTALRRALKVGVAKMSRSIRARLTHASRH
jgi:ribosomal protein S14